MVKLRLLTILLTLIILIGAGTISILYARGYRFGLKQNQITLSPRGLLVANSDPNGAQVFVSGELETATNNTISLSPGTYDVQIKKEGYLGWQKRIVIEKEVVTQIDAFLIPTAPSLSALTYSGVFNLKLSPDFSKIAYGIPPNSDNGERAGLWVLETVNLPLGFNRDPRQITDGDLTNANWEWSPDGREILLTTKSASFLLNAGEFTSQNQRVNVASQVSEIKSEWQKKIDKKLESQVSKLPDELKSILERKATDIKFSPDENRILYTASGSATIPDNLEKELPGASTQKQERDIKDTKSYVYDIKEDRNFAVGDPGESLSWLPNSLNLLLPKEDKIIVLDYDGTNRQTVFSGNYVYPHAYPSTSSNRILILTNLGGEDKFSNLYWLSLK
jgi:hypothetical protein